MLGVIGLLYILDCAYLGGGNRFRWIGMPLRLERSAWGFESFLPWSLTFISEDFPIAWDRNGIVVCPSHRWPSRGNKGRGYRFIAFETIHSCSSRGSDLFINGEHILQTLSSEIANSLVEQVQELCALATPRRERIIISFIKRRFSTSHLESRLELIRKRTLPLRFLCTLFTVLWLGFAFGLLFESSLLLFWIEFLALFGSMWTLILILFWWNHRVLYPGDRDQRIQSILSMILCFPAASRAPAALSRNSIAAFHPLASAKTLSSRLGFVFIANSIDRGLFEIPIAEMELDHHCRRILVHFRHEVLSTQKRFLRSSNVSSLRPPEDEAMEAYCPRCSGAYIKGVSRCHDCDLPLVILASAN